MGTRWIASGYLRTGYQSHALESLRPTALPIRMLVHLQRGRSFIPYRTLSHPAITLWEQRQALASLRQLGREQVDEAELFRMIRQMRDIVDTAQHTTRKARRDQERRQHLKMQSPSGKLAPPVTGLPDPQTEGQSAAMPFGQIEEW